MLYGACFIQNQKGAKPSSRFRYYGPQIKFCGWAYEMNFYIWNFMPISKNREKRSSVIEVQITK